MIELKSSQDLSKNNGVKILIYAPAGVGKTALCATAPRPIVISAESGLLSLSKKNLIRMYGKNNPDITYNIPVIEVKSIEDLTEAYEWCLTSAADEFSTICVDSLSEIAEVVLNHAKRNVKDPRQAYGELMEKMGTTIRSFRDLQGKHVYMTSKEDYNKDEVTGISMFGPMMPGNKLAKDIPYLYDEVFHLGIGKTDEGKKYRYLRTQPDMQYQAKDRSGCLEEIEKPCLNSIIRTILKG